MEFRSRGLPARLLEQPSDVFAGLLKPTELRDILCNEYLHDLKSFFIVEADGSYRDDGTQFDCDVSARIRLIESALEKRRTILVKNLEAWNRAIVSACRRLGPNTNVHAYLSPPGGTGFDWHTDDRDVFIVMLQGSKRLLARDPNGAVQDYDLRAGDVLHLPYGTPHKAESLGTASAHLSFGVWPESLFIGETYQNYAFPVSDPWGLLKG